MGKPQSLEIGDSACNAITHATKDYLVLTATPPRWERWIAKGARRFEVCPTIIAGYAKVGAFANIVRTDGQAMPVVWERRLK